jgi:hypothetical protein
MLKGPGGSLEAGYAIADLVLEHQLNVTIPASTDCASACSLIFVAGKNRKMEELSRLGFHLPFMALGAGYNSEQYCSCPSSYKMGHQSGLSLGGSGSSLGLIMQPAFDVASGDIGLSVS